MANTKLPDTFEPIQFKKDYLNNIKPGDLAIKYGMTETQVYGYINRNELRAKKERLNSKIESKLESNITDRISKLSDKVIKTLEDIIDNSNNESNRLKACESILNISGLKKLVTENTNKNEFVNVLGVNIVDSKNDTK
jgi:hypothetical protein